jgi:hypothetical protein
MTDNTTTEFKAEGQPAFPAENKEGTSTDSSTENANADQTGASTQDKKDDGQKNDGVDERLFNHPRWVERETDWKTRFNDQEKRHAEEIAKIRDEIAGAMKGKGAPTEVPAWFGGDEAQWQQFQEWNQGLISKAKEEARSETLKEIESKSSAEQKAVDDATAFFNSEVTAIESDKTLNPQGLKIDRNKLLKTALDFDLVDSQGRWNYRAAWRFLQNGMSKGTGNQERKDLAGATTTDRGGESKPAAFVTSKDFQNPANRPW